MPPKSPLGDLLNHVMNKLFRILDGKDNARRCLNRQQFSNRLQPK
jgi:hypothetical protein